MGHTTLVALLISSSLPPPKPVAAPSLSTQETRSTLEFLWTDIWFSSVFGIPRGNKRCVASNYKKLVAYYNDTTRCHWVLVPPAPSHIRTTNRIFRERGTAKGPVLQNTTRTTNTTPVYSTTGLASRSKQQAKGTLLTRVPNEYKFVRHPSAGLVLATAW